LSIHVRRLCKFVTPGEAVWPTVCRRRYEARQCSQGIGNARVAMSPGLTGTLQHRGRAAGGVGKAAARSHARTSGKVNVRRVEKDKRDWYIDMAP